MTILPGIIIGKVFAALAPPPASSFTLTAGFGGASIGYKAGSFGSISVEPFPGTPLLEFTVSEGSVLGVIQFNGDVTSSLSGKTVWVNGVEYASNFSGWSTISGNTTGTWGPALGSAPPFAEFASYTIEFK